MDECGICYDAKPDKTLPCKHTLCTGCFSRLVQTICPFCRSPFRPVEDTNISFNELNERINGLIARLIRLLPERLPAQRRRRRQLTEAEVLARRAKIRARQKRHREHQGRFYAKRWWAEEV